MIEASELLRSYVRGILDLSGAGSVTLFVPAPLSGVARPQLIHQGELPPVSELATLERALELAAGDGRRALAESPTPIGPVVVDSEGDDTLLLGLPSVEFLWSDVPTPGRRQEDEADADLARPPAAWIGLRLRSDKGSGLQGLTGRSLPVELNGEGGRRWWDWLFAIGGALASHTSQVASILRDPVTGLPDRLGLQAILTEEIQKSRLQSRPLSLLLINPDDFAAINERFGREAGDTIIREISTRLRAALRGTDAVARYGGVIFAAVLLGTPADEVKAVAEKVLRALSEGAFLDGAVRLGFSIGTVALDPDDPAVEQALDLIRRADQALNAAKRLGGSCIAEWGEGSAAAETGAFDRLSGIFTGNMAKDYRNMVLLSDALEVMATHDDFEGLAGAAVERIYSAFRPERAGLFARDEDGELVLVRGLTRRSQGRQARLETAELGPRLMEQVRRTAAAGKPCETAYEVDGAAGRLFSAVPLVDGERCLGCLFLDGPEESLGLETSDLIVLRALASQLALALDRARLAEVERRRQEGEKKQLRAELNELRQALRQSKLVYRSQKMEHVVTTARRVAPTDATILITGESGTGKELLASTVHELSPRSREPFVIVDCGAIAATLIESELFGHEKGAYTGAMGRRIGRLAEADGGTVLLDEIGELPLEVQSKLLRFVQEKQFTTVGGTRPRRVDVRILAATNRDLAAEVRAGRFREDLYHRLNVVRLEVPPLRQRPSDVLHLARHFVEAFSVQYQKSVHRLTPAAEKKLESYSWPGNVRELQNRLMQAVILCEGEELDAADLMLPAGSALSPPARSTPAEPRRATARAPEPAADDEPSTFEESCPTDPDEAWCALRSALAQEIDLALGGAGRAALPLGRWLSDDLVLEAHAASDGVARRGAQLVGIPETTFRRRLTKASELARAGLSPRSGTWEEVRSALIDLVRTEPNSEEDLLSRAERILLEEIVTRVPDDTRTGSGLLGVTPPTFRGRLEQLAAS